MSEPENLPLEIHVFHHFSNKPILVQIVDSVAVELEGTLPSSIRLMPGQLIPAEGEVSNNDDDASDAV